MKEEEKEEDKEEEEDMKEEEKEEGLKNLVLAAGNPKKGRQQQKPDK